jgi:hypothetical protein
MKCTPRLPIDRRDEVKNWAHYSLYLWNIHFYWCLSLFQNALGAKQLVLQMIDDVYTIDRK